MKKYWFLFFVAGASVQLTVAQTSPRPTDSIMRYYSQLANSGNESDRAKLETQLYQLLNGVDENDWSTAQRLFTQMKRLVTADSIAKAVRVKFPLGQTVRNAEAEVIAREPDPVKKEALYKVWVNSFPPEKFGENRILYDHMRHFVATRYAAANNVKKALEYTDMIETPSWKGEGWALTAAAFVKSDNLNEALSLYKKARDYAITNTNYRGGSSSALVNVGNNNSIAEILIKQKKYAEALPYIKEAHDSSRTLRIDINANYAKILMALGKDQEAYGMIDEAVKIGQATQEMKADLRTLYTKVKGNSAGYDEYMASVNKILAQKIRQDLVKQLVKLPAPMFTLKDVNGNIVSLADYKGKTVVLDFWATWCGPCKASFPGMKMAMEKYKDDSTVQFFFIDTREIEKGAVAAANARKYVNDNHYPFVVLMDEKDAETGSWKAFDSFKGEALPTKFVINNEGNIRFKFRGGASGDDMIAEEVVAMIELAKNSK